MDIKVSVASQESPAGPSYLQRTEKGLQHTKKVDKVEGREF